MNKNLVVFLLSLWHELLAEEYSIKRRVFKVTKNNVVKWDVQSDLFELPPSNCSAGNGSVQCTYMGGKAVSSNGCKCECKEEKSTFGLYNSWKCINNTIFHQFSGCSHRLDNRQITDPIITIPRMVNSQLDYLLPSLQISNDCNVTEGRYLTCSGTWELLSRNDLAKFYIDQYLHNGEWLWYLYNNENLRSIKGQVIQLNIECRNRSPNPRYCVIFKVKGEFKCPLPPTPSQSATTVPTMSSTTQIRPRPRPPPPSTITTATITTTKPTTTHKRTSQEPVQTVTNPTTWPSQSATTVQRISPTTQIRQRPPPSSTITTATITTTKPTTTHKRTSQEPVQTVTNPTTWVSILTELVSSTPGHTVGHQSTTRTKESTPFTTTSFSEKKRKKSASKESDKSGLIAGAIAGVIGLAIIAMTIVVMIKRRKKRESEEQRTDTFDNAGYGRGQDNSLRFNGQQAPDEDEYSYAYNNAAPFVKTNKQDLENYTNNDHEPGSFVANQVYGNTEELNRKASAPYNEAPVYNTLEEAVYAKVDKSRKENPSNSDAPIYNTLEEPEYANVDKSQKTSLSENHNEPLYNVLEGPETEEGLSEEPPCYQVLEGPFSEGAPVYDVLEGPESDEAPVYDVLEGPESDEAPVYGVLEGQDPHVYGALDMPDIQGSPEENRGYDDMVYDSVGDVINDQGDIYQELNQSGQRNSDVYQALNYPDKTIYLNELNQTHSSA